MKAKPTKFKKICAILDLERQLTNLHHLINSFPSFLFQSESFSLCPRFLPICVTEMKDFLPVQRAFFKMLNGIQASFYRLEKKKRKSRVNLRTICKYHANCIIQTHLGEQDCTRTAEPFRGFPRLRADKGGPQRGGRERRRGAGRGSGLGGSGLGRAGRPSARKGRARQRSGFIHLLVHLFICWALGRGNEKGSR